MTYLTTNFSDIFKSSFYENVASFNLLDCIIGMLFAFVLGLFIFYVYKKTFNGVMYSRSFGVSLMAMTLISTLVILAVTSNVVLSLGMVGALSIVRFRTAIKEPLDIAFLFWSIGVGIVLGAGMLPLAVFGSLFIGILMILFVNKKTTDMPYILVANCASDNSEKEILSRLNAAVKKYVVKSKSVSAAGIELTAELRLDGASTEFINQLLSIEGVSNAALVSYNGDYMS